MKELSGDHDDKEKIRIFFTADELAIRLGKVGSAIRSCFHENVRLAPMSWMCVGGVAKNFFAPDSLYTLLSFLKCNDKQIVVIGACSNLIISDSGIDDSSIVIRLKGQGFTQLEVFGEYIYAGAAVLFNKLSKFAYRNALSGFEFCIGIPGSVGGAVAMNAGCYGADVSGIIVYVVAADQEGNLHVVYNKELGFRYRGNGLDSSWVICGALFKGRHAPKLTIHTTMQAIQKQRYLSQPIFAKTSGCTFKNPKGQSAWKLIDSVGCRGMKIGGAVVSDKHCNFIINYDNATASDIVQLIVLIQERVKQKFGIILESEVKMLGRFPKFGS